MVVAEKLLTLKLPALVCATLLAVIGAVTVCVGGALFGGVHAEAIWSPIPMTRARNTTWR
jgi:hypothetical protein